MTKEIFDTTQKKIGELVKEIRTLKKQIRHKDEIINRFVSEGGNALKDFWGRGHCPECGEEYPRGACVKCGEGERG